MLIVLFTFQAAHAQTRSPATGGEPNYLVFQMGADNKDFASVLPELKAEFGAKPAGSSRYVGFGVALMTLKTPVEELRRQVNRALNSAEETGLPVLIKLDDMNFPTEYTDPSMVEWTAFPKPGEAHGPLVKHYWLNWGSWMALPPSPNLESVAFRKNVEMRLKEVVLPPLLERLARWKDQNRSYLFAGVCVGWESGIPEYRPMRQVAVLPRDEQRKITMTEEERGVQFGYASLYSRGWTQQKIQETSAKTGKSVEDVTTDLLFQVIHDYTSFFAKTVHDAGIPQERIYTHGVAWESVPDKLLPGAWMRKSSRVPPIWVNVNPYSRPGYTAGAGQFDSVTLVKLLRAAGAHDGWGAVEAYVRGVESEDAFEGYLSQLFGSGARMVDIFGWTATGSPYDPKRAPGALRSIHSWLEGKELRQPSAQTMPAQGTAPGAVPQPLQEKMHQLQALVERLQQQGGDLQPLQPVGELMQGFQPLMQQKKFSEAEALVDRALELVKKLGPAQTGGPPASLQRKRQCLEGQVQKWQREGKDLQPIGEIMQAFQPLVEQQKFAEAEQVIDRALKLVGEACPDQPASAPGVVPPVSLPEKMQRLQALVNQREQAGANLQSVGELMQGFEPLMQQKKFSEAEALLDRALKLANELPLPSSPQAGAPPWLQETMRRVKKPTADDPNYVIYQFMGDSQHPDQARSWVEKLQADFGRQKPGQSKYIGFGFFIQDLNDDMASLRQRIETLLGIGEKFEMPVFIHLDGVMFWDRRADGLPANPEAVEWSAFPTASQKTGPVFKRTWFDWGEVTSLPAAPPCFESALFRADVKERLEKAVADPIRAALTRWRAGPVDRTYLFAGITVGNEIGVPDYRTFRLKRERNPNSPRPLDKKTGVEMTDAEMARGGYCSLYHRGYTQAKISEIARQRFGADDATSRTTDVLITELLDGVVHDYMAFRAKILRDGLAGSDSAQMRIYTHTTSTFRKNFERTMPLVAESIPTIAAAVNPYSRPGFTVVRNAVDLPDVLSQMRAAAGGTANSSVVPWGAVESYATVAQPGPPQSREQYGAYLDMLFGSGAKLVSLLEAPQNANNPFTIAAESPGVKSAIRDWLRK